MEWVILFNARKFLGGFDGEFSYKEWNRQTVVLNSDSEPEQNEIVAQVRRKIHSAKAEIEILRIVKSEKDNCNLFE